MKLARLSLISVLILSLVGANPVAADDSMLWTTSIGYAGAVVNSGTDVLAIPSYARLRDLTFSVPKLNPDVLVVGLRFDGVFETSPLGADKKLIANVRIYGIAPTCIYNNNCDQVIVFSVPSVWNDKYPISPSATTVPVFYLPQAKTTYQTVTNTNCNAPWWIDKSDPSHSAIDFQLSITCLKIPADINAYGAAGADTGVTPIPYNFTKPAGTTNPYWQLATNAYTASGGASTVGKPYITPSPQPAPNYIACKKGKVTKKILGANAVCPKGYTKQGQALATSQ
jgi:hypothetical protein